MIIMPSMPRLSTPARSATSSPAAASKSGVEAASTDRMMASAKPMDDPALRWHEADAVEDERVAGEHVEQQDPLEHLGQIERDLHRDLRLLATDEGQRQEQARDQDADRIEPPEERDDDGGEAVAGGNAGLQVADRTGNLDDAGEARQRPRYHEGEDGQLIGIEAGEARRLGRGSDHADLEALDGASEHHGCHRHDHERDQRAKMQTAPLDQGRHGGARVEFGGDGEVVAVWIAPGAAHEVIE